MNDKKNIFSLTREDTFVLKGIAIIAMLIHYLWTWAPLGVERYSGVLGFLGISGKVYVSIFLFCSGYGLCVGYSSLMDKTEWRRYKLACECDN